MRTIDFLERPIVSYSIMGIFSLAAAVIFFQIGGSFAEVAGEEGTFLGLSIKAGGAIAGFVIIFFLSLKGIEKLNDMPEKQRLLSEYILRVPAPPEGPTDSTLVCRYRLYDRESGDWGEWRKIGYVRAGHGLTISVRDIKPQHSISVRLEDAQSNLWESEEDLAYGVSPIKLRRVQAIE